MSKLTVLLVVALAALRIATGLVTHSRGGGAISRWIAAHRANAGH